MANPYYVAGGTPGTGSFGASAPIRSEFTAIQAGFALLPQTFTANKAVVINSAGAAMGLTAGSLALAGDFATTGAFGLTIAVSAAITLTAPAVSGTIATLAGTETLSNKTLVAPLLGTPASGNLANCTGFSASGLSGILPAANFPALTGDISTVSGALATTLATVNSSVGAFGSASAVATFTVNAKGLITAAASSSIVAPAGTLSGTVLNATVVTSSLTTVGTIGTGVWQGTVITAAYGGTGISSLGTNVATALGVNVGSAGAFVTFNGAGGTPSSITLTNASGTAASLTAGTVTTNANLTGPIASSGNTTSITSQTGTGTKFVVDTSPTLITPNLGTPTAGVLTSCTGYPVASVANLAAGIATFLTTPSSANLATALTDKTGTGANVFAGSPALTGTPTFAGATSGTIGLVATAIAGSNTLTLPAQTGTLLVGGTQITASLGSDVAMNNSAIYFSGPTVAQGSTGTWKATGTVTFGSSAIDATWYAKLWDGTNLIASAAIGVLANAIGSISLSGFRASPSGNLRIDVRNATGNDGSIKFNQTGNSLDSTITAFRVA